MRLRSAAVPLLAILLVACGGESGFVDGYMDEYGGSRTVYERIEDQTDCASLEAEFDATAANNEVLDPGTDEYRYTSGYMAAAEERMDELGCETD